MNESILGGILQEIREIRNEMATKSELEEIRRTMATKTELEGIRIEMNTGFEEIRNEMNTGFSDLKHTINEHHSENIRADEKLLELISATNEKIDQNDKWTREQLRTHEIKIGILNQNQLDLQAELCKKKSG